MTVKSNTTVVLLEFHTWENGMISLDAGEPLGRVSAAPAGQTPLISYLFEKKLGASTGNFSVVMKARAQGCYFSDGDHLNGEPWLNLLNEGDWWAMTIQRNGQKLVVGYGKIDMIISDLTSDRGATVSTITVRGRDVGFGLEDVPVYFNPFDAMAQNIVGIDMLQFIGGQGGFAKDVITGMIEGMFGYRNGSKLYGSQIRFPPTFKNKFFRGIEALGPDVAGAASYFNLLKFDVQRDLEGQVVIPQPILNVQQSDQSVWDYASVWRNPVMNELFVDIDPFKSLERQSGIVILREKPFVNDLDGVDSPWFTLPVAEVDAKTLLSSNLTKGVNRVNHLLVLGDLSGVFGDEVYGIHPPAFNDGSVQRYGLRRRLEQTNYFEALGVEASEDLLREWKGMVLSWNVLNHKYLQGRLVIGEARADIRVGAKIAIVNGPLGNDQAFADAPGPPNPDPNEEFPYHESYTFYVEGIRYEGQFGMTPRHQTLVEVSRGYAEFKRVPDISLATGQWEEFALAGASDTNATSQIQDQQKPPEGPRYDPHKGGT